LAKRLDLKTCAHTFPEIAVDIDLLIIAVPDSQIAEVDRMIASYSSNLDIKSCVHTSGAFPGSILQSLQQSGISVGSLHPLQTFSPHSPPPLKDIYFVLEGAEQLRNTLGKIVKDIGGIPIHLPEGDKTLYHSAAVFASNFIPVLMNASVELMRQAGLSDVDSRKMLAPLMTTSLNNCLDRGELEALTGPVSRGDISTVQGHVSALQSFDPLLSRIYKLLSLKALSLALEHGLAKDKAKAIEQILLS